MAKKHCVSIMSAIGLFALISTSVPVSESAGAEKVSERDRFQLWNKCEPIDLLVQVQRKGTKDLAPKKEAIETAARSRLRIARLYDPDSTPFVLVSVLVIGDGFNRDLDFYKPVTDQVSGILSIASTWTTGGAGLHYGDGNRILAGIARNVDEFVDDYRRVNDSACSR